MDLRSSSRRLSALASAGAAAVLILSSSGAAAQQQGFDAEGALEHGFGLAWTEHGLRGVGPGYLATFDAGAFVFTPALGRSAPTSMPVAFRLEEVAYGDYVLLDVGAPVAPVVEDGLVVYRHAGGVDERYELRADGVHQTFLFRDLPACEGELVVRGRLSTDLLNAPAAEGARFDLPGVGGVRWGGVTGVDARGATAPGDVRVEGDVIELTLPDAFVRGASLPLVLDPLISGTLDLVGGGSDASTPDVAYDAVNDVYCVTWESHYAADHVEAYARLFSFAGTPQSGTIILATNPLVFQPFEGRAPHVAGIRDAERFLAVWQESANGATPAVRARSISAADGSASPSIVVSASAAAQRTPVVGGERGIVDNDGLVVWHESGAGILARQVGVTAGAPTAIGAVHVLSADSFLAATGEPAIARTAGDAGRFLVAWRRTLADGDVSVEARVIDRHGNPQSGVIALSDLSAFDETAPAVDGDGTRWVVAWERNEIWFPAKRDVVARSIEWNGASFETSDVEYVVSFPDDDQFAPSVAWTGTSALVQYVDAAFDLDHVMVETLDPFTAIPFGSALMVQTAIGEVARTAAAAEWSGGIGEGNQIDNVLLVYDWSPDGSPDLDVRARRFDGSDDTTDLGGGCPGGGVNVNPAAVQGNDAFTPRLIGAAPAAPTFFVVSPQALPFDTGACTWTPSLLGSTPIFALATDADGDAELVIPIPDQAGGVTVYTQWATLQAGGGSPLLGGVSFSNALEVEIQQAN